MAKSFNSNKIYCDVAVIGGGVIGASVSYYLAKKNFNVILLEKSYIAAGASGACDGFIFLQSKKDKDIISLTLKSIDIFKKLSDELSYDIEYEKCGGLVIYSAGYSVEDIDLFELTGAYEVYCRKHYKKFDEKIDIEHCGKYVNGSTDSKNDIEKKFIKILDNRGLKSIEPFISDNARFGTFCSHEGHVNPLALNFAFALSAKKNGAEIYSGEEVKSFKLDNSGKIKKIFTGSGKQIIADEIVLCAGAWTSSLGELLGVKIPIKPRKGVIIVTETLPKMIYHPIIDYDYLCCKFDLDRELGFTVEQTKSGNLLIGSTREFTGFDSRFDFKKISDLLNRAVKIFPMLSNVCIIRVFDGFRPFSCDLKPFIGMIPGFINLWIASGHEGDGIALSPITGKLISELIISKKKNLNGAVQEKSFDDELYYDELYKDIKDFDAINIRKFSPEKRIYPLI